MQTIKVECSVCCGTGLYVGFTGPKGTAVVCVQCDGTGCAEIRFTPFTHRNDTHGITSVSRSSGSFISTGVGPTSTSITYQEFQQGKMP